MKFKCFVIALIIIFINALTPQNALARSSSIGAGNLLLTLDRDINPVSLDFNNQLAGTTSSPQTITITNNDAVDLIIGTLSVTGEFTLSNDLCSGQTVASSATCTFDVTFSPLSIGVKSGSVSIPSDAASSPDSLSLSGTGVSPAIGINPASLDFGNQAIGTASVAQTVTITNTGTADLIIGTLSVTGEFTLSNDLCSGQTVTPSATCTFDVTFSPLSVGAKNESVSIPSNSASSPDSVALNGTGVSPAMEINPVSLDFGNQAIGTASVAQTVTITNTGTADLTIGTLSVTGEFALSNDLCSGQTVAPSATCTFDVTFSPLSIGVKSGSVSIPSNAVSSPDSIALNGTGVRKTWYVAMTGNNTNDCLTKSTPCSTINGAIGKAAAGDTIKVAIGIYTGVGPQVVPIDKNITLSGGWNAAFSTQNGKSTIDGGGKRQGVAINSGITVVIDHFTIRNGFTKYKGGGIYNSGTMTLSNSIVSSNVSKWMGGGIFNNDTLTINNTTISDNSAGDSCCSGGGGGGGIQNAGILILNNTTVSNNIIHGNFDGSGIENSGKSLTINNSTISGNKNAVSIYTSYGTVRLNNSTVSGNLNGGIDKYTGSIILNNSTVFNNGFGIYTHYGYNGSVIMQNSILAGNTVDCIGTIKSAGFNLIGNLQCTFNAKTGDKVGTITSPINPFLGSLKNNGGPTFTHALLIGSPAINAGNPAIPGSGGYSCLATDQRGVTRPVGSACDIGAYEVNAPFNIPSPILPYGNTGGPTPTYKWYKISGATKYQYQVFKGTKIMYTKIVDASICGAKFCLSTPANILSMDTYKWRVRAMINGVWNSYSLYNTFTPIQKPGLWASPGLEFYVTKDFASVDNFAIYINVSGCGNYKITHNPLVPIVNKKFFFNGSFYASGAFTTTTAAKGSLGLNYYYIPGCGYVSGGPFTWKALWKNNNQPLFVGPQEMEITVTPVSGVPLNLFSIFNLIHP